MSKSHPINPSVSVSAAAFFLAVAVTSSTSLAQLPVIAVAPTASAPAPCLNDPERHHFDFWIGAWNVTTKTGSPAGSSVIQSVSGGCALLENWTSMRGGNGKSLNAYNPFVHQWQQYWIGQDGAVAEYRTSQFDGTSLIFFMKGEASDDSVVRLTFTPLDSTTVRQHSESSGNGGKTWNTQYDLYYHRKTR
jgi:hypothetical protein